MFFKRLFQRAELKESTKRLCNPDRGFYPLLAYTAGEKLNREELGADLAEGERLVLLLVDIGQYRDRQLDEDTLAQMREVLRFLVERKRDIILRVVYDREGKSMQTEPAQFRLVTAHMEQVGALVREFGKHIFVYQGFLVGNWGEMHGSRYLAAHHLMTLAETMERYTQGNTFLAVRCPYHFRQIYGRKDRYEEFAGCGLGFFDDGILGSDTDIGTYSLMPDEYTDWEGSWNKKRELEFENILCQYVPNGGETVWGDGYAKTLSPQQLCRYFQTKHITYLNRLYDTRVLEEWKRQQMTDAGVWNGRDLYGYIDAHLGYRFLVTGVRVGGGHRADGRRRLQVQVTIANTGFANAYRKMQICLVTMSKAGKRCEYATGWRLHEVTAGMTKKLETQILIPADGQEYQLILEASRTFDETPVYFGNERETEGVLLGVIQG